MNRIKIWGLHFLGLGYGNEEALLKTLVKFRFPPNPRNFLTGKETIGFSSRIAFVVTY
jgi:hypothetical protein